MPSTSLVIVESPAKARTIGKYLGNGYVVTASYGHVRDLPKSTMGVDIPGDFAPEYVVPGRAKKVVTELKKRIKASEAIYFATDEDREGEAIAWHLLEALKPKTKHVYRITFDEVTKKAIQHAIEHPREINTNLVDAQQARRILDRLVGYELSPFLWNKVRRGLSAGRVQSVAVRLIVEREREIEAFTPQEYWSIEADLRTKSDDLLTTKLFSRNGKKIGKLDIKTKKEAEEIKREASSSPFRIESVSEKTVRRSPSPPFTTSTLQQQAANQLGFSAKKTMVLAQRLYEGVELGDEGPMGLITYMRTDSVQMASDAVSAIRELLSTEHGNEYVPQKPRAYKTKSRGAQEAHEAIRPTNPSITPQKASAYLERDMARLYSLIWKRAVASQTEDAKFSSVTADVKAGSYVFRATGSRILFPGYLAVTGTEHIKETLLPKLAQGDILTPEEIRTLQHATQPPARYSEAALVKALEEHGIGRPSTYAPTIDTIQQRGYVEKDVEDKRFRPTDVGTIVNDILVKHFPNIVDITFTARMEDDLDSIAEGKKEMVPVLKAFYKPFHENLVKKEKELSRDSLTTEKTDKTCPECKKPLLLRLGRHGRFYGCEGYPDCKYTEPANEQEKNDQQNAPTGKECPECGKPLVLKRGKFGTFLGCEGYPDCKHTERIEQKTGVSCPKCEKGEIVARRSKRGRTFYGCNAYPDCDFVLWSKPNGEKCPECTSLLVFGKQETTQCSNKECSYTG